MRCIDKIRKILAILSALVNTVHIQHHPWDNDANHGKLIVGAQVHDEGFGARHPPGYLRGGGEFYRHIEVKREAGDILEPEIGLRPAGLLA